MFSASMFRMETGKMGFLGTYSEELTFGAIACKSNKPSLWDASTKSNRYNELFTIFWKKKSESSN